MVGKKDGLNPTIADKEAKLKRFAIAGEDKKWVWADAVIDGKTVVVSSPKVAKPVAVRYAYSVNPAGCNLYNKEGLPASPFRTDDWEIKLQP
jgi:sialate O-acetylesterase